MSGPHWLGESSGSWPGNCHLLRHTPTTATAKFMCLRQTVYATPASGDILSMPQPNFAPYPHNSLTCVVTSGQSIAYVQVFPTTSRRCSLLPQGRSGSPRPPDGAPAAGWQHLQPSAEANWLWVLQVRNLGLPAQEQCGHSCVRSSRGAHGARQQKL